MSNVTYPNVSFFRDGNLMHANRGGVFKFVGFTNPTGAIGSAVCYEAVTVIDAYGRRRTMSAESYGGAFTACVRTAKGERQWFGIADAETVAETAIARLSR